MTVRAKFQVNRIERTRHWKGDSEVQTIVMSPVVGGSPENDKFFEATPSGEIRMGVIPLEVAVEFELGGEMYVDFTPVKKAQGH